MEKQPNPAPGNNEKPTSGGCVPMITTMVGFGMMIVGVLAVLNTAFGWNLVLEVSGAEVEVPKYWDSTIAVLVVGGLIALIGWVMGRPSVTRFYRKNKLLVILGSIGLVVGIFFMLNEYDKSIKRANAEKFAKMDSLGGPNGGAYGADESDDPDAEPAYNPYADREITFLISNPTVDTMKVLVDGEEFLQVEPYEMEKGELSAGTHQLVATVNGKTVETVELDFPERTKATVDEITVINVDSFFNIAVLDFQDYYDSNNKKRKGAETINYRLPAMKWHEHIFTLNAEKATLVLPRHISLDFSRGNALKFVLVPEEFENDDDKAFDYAIWKFIDEEKKGYMQDGMDFFMLSGKKRQDVIRNRLSEDAKRFEKENE